MKTKFDEIAFLKKEQYLPKQGENLNYIGLEHINQQTLSLNGIGNSSSVMSQKYRFNAGDILFGRLRPYFRKVIKPTFDGVCSTDIWVVKAKEGFDQTYLYYLMASQRFIDKSVEGSTGTRMPRADWNHLSKTEWDIPSLEEQKEIGEILSALDDKIELNLQTNATLEAIAQAIFKEWFIDFNFPGTTGEMVESNLGLIPKYWDVKTLGTILDVKGGTTPSTKVAKYWNGECQFATPKDISKLQSPFLFTTERKITKEGVNQISSGVLPKGTLLLSSRAPIGYVAISTVPVSVNQGFIAINARETSNIFIMLWIKSNLEKIIGMANGSTFLEISKSDFCSIKIVVPEKRITKLFDDQIIPLFDQIMLNSSQISMLALIRDLLITYLFVTTTKSTCIIENLAR